MKSANTNVFVRPPRILFLIESEEHYRTAVKLCSSLWGGFFCEIMLKDIFGGVKNPDVCYDFVVDLSKAEEDKDSPNWKLGLDDIVKIDCNREGLDFVDARALYIELAERDVEIIAPGDMGSPEQSLLSLMRFGCPGEFNKRNYLDDLKTKFKIVPVTTDGAMGTEANKGQGTPIQITTVGLKQKDRMLRDQPGTVVLIGDRNSLDDLSCAWNFRARHSRVLFVDRATSGKHFEELKNLIAKEIEEIKKSEDENKKFSLGWTYLSSDPSDSEKFEEQLKSVGCHVLRALDRWRYIDSKRALSFFARSEEEYLNVTVDGRNIHPNSRITF